MVSEFFDPDGQVIRSKKTSEEKEKDGNDSENISVANNIPNSNQQITNPSQMAKIKSKVDDITNYEISKTVTNKIVEEGGVEKLSVGILIDGYYETDEKTKKQVYYKRSNEELVQLKILVQSAIGFDESRGDKLEIINLEFVKSEFEGSDEKVNWLDENLKNLIQMGRFKGCNTHKGKENQMGGLAKRWAGSIINASRIPPRPERRPAHKGQLTKEAVGGVLNCIGQ